MRTSKLGVAIAGLSFILDWIIGSSLFLSYNTILCLHDSHGLMEVEIY